MPQNNSDTSRPALKRVVQRRDLIRQLQSAGSIGLDLSPGDPLCAAAALELERSLKIETAAAALLADVRRRFPGEALRCEFMRALDAALLAS
jgi:hypothetical protein